MLSDSELVWKRGKIVTWDITISPLPTPMLRLTSNAPLFTAGVAAELAAIKKDCNVRGVDPSLFVRATRLRGHWNFKLRGRGVFSTA